MSSSTGSGGGGGTTGGGVGTVATCVGASVGACFAPDPHPVPTTPTRTAVIPDSPARRIFTSQDTRKRYPPGAAFPPTSCFSGNTGQETRRDSTIILRDRSTLKSFQISNKRRLYDTDREVATKTWRLSPRSRAAGVTIVRSETTIFRPAANAVRTSSSQTKSTGPGRPSPRAALG